MTRRQFERLMKPGKPILRRIIITGDGDKREEGYWLGKRKDGTFFIGFTFDGSSKSRDVGYWEMFRLANDVNLSAKKAFELYVSKACL